MTVENILEKIRSEKESEEELGQFREAFGRVHWPELDRTLEADWQNAGQPVIAPEISSEIWAGLASAGTKNRYKWALALFAVATLLLLARLVTTSGSLIAINTVERVNESDGLMPVQLPDGSTAILNRGSTLRYEDPFREACRDLWLSGEAYFSVSQQPDRPFRVITEQLETSGLGTEFNIRAYREDNHATISLFAGQVAITPKKRIANQPGRWLLEPGDQMRFQKSNQTPIVFRFDSTLTMAWRDNRVAFDEAPMATALLQLERHFGTKIDFDPEKVLDCFARGNFDEDAKLDHILKKILPYRQLKFKTEEGVVKITGKGCRPSGR